MNYELCLLSVSTSFLPMGLTEVRSRNRGYYCMETDPDGFTCHESSIWSTLLERNSNVGAFSPACDGGPVTTGTSVKKEGIRGSSRCQADSRRGGP